MAYFQTVAYTTTGTKDSLNLDPSISPFNASVVVSLSNTGTYKLQFSLDPETVADASAVWNDSVNIPAGTTSSAVTNFMFPVSRVRLIIAAVSGTVTLQVRQGFTSN